MMMMMMKEKKISVTTGKKLNREGDGWEGPKRTGRRSRCVWEMEVEEASGVSQRTRARAEAGKKSPSKRSLPGDFGPSLLLQMRSEQNHF